MYLRGISVKGCWVGWGDSVVGCVMVKNMTKNTATTTHVEEGARRTRVVLFRGKRCVSCTGYNLPCCVKNIVTRQRGLFMRAPRTFKGHFGVSIHAQSRMVTVRSTSGAISVHASSKGACARDCSGLLLSPNTSPIHPPLPNVSGRKVFALHGIGSASTVGDCLRRRGIGQTMVVKTKFVKLRVTRGLRRTNTRITIMRVTGRIVTPVSFSVTSLIRRRLLRGKIRLCLRGTITSFRHAIGKLRIVFGSNRELPTSVILLSVKMHPGASLTARTKLRVKRVHNVGIGSCLRASSRRVCTINSTVRFHRPLASEP